ncbi:MAG: hypothetical protein N3G22_03670 [Candidatus Micrarchaeota archaeon]|nr:hypothetical protein [Candidatus Micrarchaeota archaeon]
MAGFHCGFSSCRQCQGVGWQGDFSGADLHLIGSIFALVPILISLYNIYNYHVLLKTLHQLSAFRAVLLIVVPFLLAIGVVFYYAAVALGAL